MIFQRSLRKINVTIFPRKVSSGNKKNIFLKQGKKKILIEIFYHFHGINSMKITQILFLLIYRVPWSRSQIIRKLVSTKIILVVCSCSLYLCIQFSNICNRYILFFCTTVYSQLYLFHFGRNFFENSVLEDRQWFSISRLNSNFHSI